MVKTLGVRDAKACDPSAYPCPWRPCAPSSSADPALPQPAWVPVLPCRPLSLAYRRPGGGGPCQLWSWLLWVFRPGAALTVLELHVGRPQTGQAWLAPPSRPRWGHWESVCGETGAAPWPQQAQARISPLRTGNADFRWNPPRAKQWVAVRGLAPHADMGWMVVDGRKKIRQSCRIAPGRPHEVRGAIAPYPASILGSRGIYTWFCGRRPSTAGPKPCPPEGHS